MEKNEAIRLKKILNDVLNFTTDNNFYVEITNDIKGELPSVWAVYICMPPTRKIGYYKILKLGDAIEVLSIDIESRECLYNLGTEEAPEYVRAVELK